MAEAALPDRRNVRERLLDAVETLVARHGRGGLSHRAIARAAGTHVSLLHYHFGTVAQSLEEAVGRRAQRLVEAQLAALRQRTGARASVEDVVSALWRPFAVLGSDCESGWRDYLCLVARLANDDAGAPGGHFAEVDRAALRALATALPHAGDDALASGLRLTRRLFEREALERCGSERLSGAELAQRERRLRLFAAAGLRALAGPGEPRPLLHAAP